MAAVAASAVGRFAAVTQKEATKIVVQWEGAALPQRSRESLPLSLTSVFRPDSLDLIVCWESDHQREAHDRLAKVLKLQVSQADRRVSRVVRDGADAAPAEDELGLKEGEVAR